MRSYGVIPPSVRRLGGLSRCPRGTRTMAFPATCRTFQRAPVHVLLVSKLYIMYDEAMSTFPQWMAAVAQAFSQWIEPWMVQDYSTFRG